MVTKYSGIIKFDKNNKPLVEILKVIKKLHEKSESYSIYKAHEELYTFHEADDWVFFCNPVREIDFEKGEINLEIPGGFKVSQFPIETLLFITGILDKTATCSTDWVNEDGDSGHLELKEGKLEYCYEGETRPFTKDNYKEFSIIFNTTERYRGKRKGKEKHAKYDFVNIAIKLSNAKNKEDILNKLNKLLILDSLE